MLNHALIIARKEIRDHLRDTRSLVSSGFYAVMGPLVVGMVSLALKGAKSSAVILSMMSLFALVASFSGGMNLAMDSIAGERERRSLLPLLMNPLRLTDLIVGKWIAISVFAIAGIALTLAAFCLTLRLAPGLLIRAGIVLVPLVLFAAAVELLISTWCRSTKEAHTYLSLAIFLPMGLGMFLIFFPHTESAWFWFPVAGQQLLMNLLVKGSPVPLLSAGAIALISLVCAAGLLRAAARLLQQDEFVYGG
ncbi:MAG TPA: ABC transporter permease subunit [Bryobacteraceae bacterium]|nr:ABC transporter permease subunit [Bryobacteraceae bacterium]